MTTTPLPTNRSVVDGPDAHANDHNSLHAFRNALVDVVVPDANGHVTTPSGSTPSAAAQAGAGTSPPAPLISGSDMRGTVSFGTGGTPAAGAQVSVTFNKAFTTAPRVFLQPLTPFAATLGAYISVLTTTGFTIAFLNAPPASQAAGYFSYMFMVAG